MPYSVITTKEYDVTCDGCGAIYQNSFTPPVGWLVVNIQDASVPLVPLVQGSSKVYCPTCVSAQPVLNGTLTPPSP